MERTMPVVARVSLRGEYDISRREELRADLAMADTTTHAVVDLTNVSFMDAGAIGLLIALAHRVRQNAPQATVEIVNAPQIVRRILHISRAEDLFSFTST